MASNTTNDGFAAELQASLPQLLESGEHSDLTIWCEGETHHVHKVVLCAHSPWFRKACTGEFKVSLIFSSESKLVTHLS
jgi:hypothetical protein